MAIAVVTSAGGESGSSSVSSQATSAFSATTGNLVCVMIRYDESLSVSSVTDTAGNTYTQAGTTADSGAGKLDIWYAKNIAGNASNVVTANLSGSAAFCVVRAVQYSGLDTSSPLDVTAKGTVASGTTVSTSPAKSTSQADEVVVACGQASTLTGAWTALTPTGYTDEGQDSNHIAIYADQIYSSIQSSVTWTYTNTDGTVAKAIVVASFKAASAGGKPQSYYYSYRPKGVFRSN